MIQVSSFFRIQDLPGYIKPILDRMLAFDPI
jgi:hypothetical protein